MSKAIAEHSNALSVFFLKKHGYLNKDDSFRYGGITWSYGGESKSRINFRINKDDWGTPEERAYINLIYTHTDSWTQEKSDMNSRIELTTTPCRYGGVRYWFICPLTKSGVYCGRRVGVLYSIGKWFGCRHCGEIAYEAQMSGGKYRWSGVSIPDIDKAESEIKRYYYRGKPTRKYRRFLRLNEKFELEIIGMAGRLGNMGSSGDFKRKMLK
jgi:hypothetical protein